MSRQKINSEKLSTPKKNDTVQIRNLNLLQSDVKLAGIVRNYLGNMVFITSGLYETLFEDYSPNSVLANLSEACSDPTAYAKELGRNDLVTSSISTQALKADFTISFSVIYAVVYLLIVMAAGLAFVVLFTLSNTNISERVKELATIKVLGFFDNEVHLYVNKETLILTGIGVLLGLPMGLLLTKLLISMLNFPSIQFVVYVEPVSYLISAVISFSFAIIVNLMTNRTLNHIDMVEALKSVE